MFSFSVNCFDNLTKMLKSDLVCATSSVFFRRRHLDVYCKVQDFWICNFYRSILKCFSVLFQWFRWWTTWHGGFSWFMLLFPTLSFVSRVSRPESIMDLNKLELQTIGLDIGNSSIGSRFSTWTSSSIRSSVILTCGNFRWSKLSFNTLKIYLIMQ